ncbi:MAG: hypothetical protein ACPHCN_12085 [Mycobacterium sp.]
MPEPIIEVPVDEILETLGHGQHWIQGEWSNSDGMCLHQAVRVCHPQPGDAYLIEQVAQREGWGTQFNDSDGTDFFVVEQSLRLRKEGIEDWQLEATFGPQWECIVALVRRAATLTQSEGHELNAAGDAAWDAAGAAARAAAWAAAWDAARAAAWDAARDAAWDAAGDVARAAAVRDLIGQHGFTQQHYDTLTGPWASVIGPVHPDDSPAT